MSWVTVVLKLVASLFGFATSELNRRRAVDAERHRAAAKMYKERLEYVQRSKKIAADVSADNVPDRWIVQP